MSHQPRKRFGQNFLHDQSVITRIVQSIAPTTDDRVVEIGPGQGALTLPLLKQAGRLTVIELDRDLIEPLRERAATVGELTIHSADALRFDFRSLANGGQIRAVGNLPYNISTPLLFHLLEQADAIRDMHFMLQKEVVDRLAAQPHSKAYGRLSVAMQARCEVTPLFTIGPGAFNPPPKVDSAVVRLTPNSTLGADIRDWAGFERLVGQAFAQRRKTLRNNLKGLLSDTQFASCDIDPVRRAETLSVNEFITLSNCLAE